MPFARLLCLSALSWSYLGLAQVLPINQKAPVGDEAWMDARMGSQSLLHSSQQLDMAGEIQDLPGRLLALEFAQGGKILLVKTTSTFASFNAQTFKLIQKSDYPVAKGGGSMHGLAVAPDGSQVLISGGRTHLYRATVAPDGTFKWGTSIDVTEGAKNVNPLGIAFTPDASKAVIALSVSNTLAVVDLATDKIIAKIPVGLCPYSVALSPDGKMAYVSNLGGSVAKPHEITEASAGSLIPVDKRSVALRGTVSVVNLEATPKVIKEIVVGLHPSEIILQPSTHRLFVANVGGDSISVVNTSNQQVEDTIDTKPDPRLPWGTLTDSLTLSEDGQSLFATHAGLNAVSRIDLANPHQIAPLIPTGWYPGAVRCQHGQLFIANVRNGVQKVALPTDRATSLAYDQRARQAAHLAHALQSNTLALNKDLPAPQPVPAQLGQPSTIQHVVYIIKENRTFDQVLGDLDRGNCDPKLCNFPRKITPNHHALTERFPLLDNYYCNGVNSSDGHAWGTQGIVTPYREKDRVGFRCGYDFGIDALFYAGCGFLWDHALLNGKSFRNYGEMEYTVKLKGKTYHDFFVDRETKAGKTAYAVSYQVSTLTRYSCLNYPGWQMSIPDQTRADVFLKELADFETKKFFPELTIIYLPNDHTAAELTANSYLADNDLALGRVIEGLSHSRFWPHMAIFVNEDDPQAGHDHVDGHRSFCFVASPYAKKGAIVSKFYNQTSVLHTMCRILGVPPMNQIVAASPTMEDCFCPTPDLSPYTCLIPDQKLNEPRPPAPKKTSFWPPWPTSEERLEARFHELDFSLPDLIHEDTLNRAIWAQTRPQDPYPSEWAGAHGRGLARLGLKLDPSAKDDDDDDDE